MDTPGFVNENKSKPAITAQIEGTASTASAEVAAKCLLAGALRGRYIIANDLIGELVRVVANGAAPRPNPLMEVRCFLKVHPLYCFNANFE
jgi:3-dehydrosphinganine reductase